MFYLIKKFWQYNWLKLLIWCAPIVAWLVRAFTASQSSILTDGFVRFLVFIIILICVIRTIKRGMTQIKTINRLIKDTDSPISIIPLFDNGFTLAFFNKYVLYKYTSLCIKGTISGYPVTVSFMPETPSRWGYLDFSFAPLSGSVSGKDIEDSGNDSAEYGQEYLDLYLFLRALISRCMRLDLFFASLPKGTPGNNLEESIWFNMPGSGWYVKTPRLKKDIKPEVLRFVEELKEKGYTPVAQ